VPSRAAHDWLALEEAASANLNKVAGGFLGYESNSSSQTGITTTTDLTGVTVDVTTNTSRLIRIDVLAIVTIQTAAADYVGRILRDGSNIGTWAQRSGGGASGVASHTGFTWDTPSADTHTYKANLARSSGSGTLDVNGTAPSNAKILVQDLGSTS